LPHKSLVLPFVVKDGGRENPFTPEMELSAVVCLAEAQRKKPGLLSASPEKIQFISKVYYPLWIVPWEDRCIIVDGLGFSSHNLKYAELPDLKLFIEDLERNAVVHEDFMNTLEKHSETFEDFASITDISFNAIITNKNLLNSLHEYFSEGEFLEDNAETPIVLIPSKIDEKEASEACEKLINCWRKINADRKGLQQALNRLEEKTRLQENGILCEIEQIKEKYEREISNLKTAIEDKVNKLTSKLEAETKKITKKADKKLKAITKEKEKYKRKLQKLEQEEITIRKKIENFKRKGNDVKATYWNQQLKKCRKEIEKVEKEIKAISNKIEKIKGESKAKIDEIKASFKEKISSEEEKIEELKTLRDSEIEAKQKKLEELRSKKEYIANRIEELIEQKKVYASKLKEETTIPWKQDGTILAYTPLYLVKYEKNGEFRYKVHPPMIASSHKGIFKKIRKFWSFGLESRMKLLVNPRSKDMYKALSSALIETIKRDNEFEERINRICQSNDVLKKKDFGKLLTEGINELKHEGWVSLEETLAILKKYGEVKK